MNEQTTTQSFDVDALARGVTNAIIDTIVSGEGDSILDGLFRQARATGLMEAWGRLRNIAPPTPDDPNYEFKALDLRRVIFMDAFQFVVNPRDMDRDAPSTYEVTGPLPVHDEEDYEGALAEATALFAVLA